MNKKTNQGFLLILLLIFGVIYIIYSWKHHENDKFNNVILIAKSAAAALPKEDLNALEAKSTDVYKHQYKEIKNALKAIILANPRAKFAYIYTIRKNKIFFIADSEPVNSSDYSPPGQEYTEAKMEDKQPFFDGKVHITKAMTDRWGTWTSILIPIVDEGTGKVTAVFGIDFSTQSWSNYELYEVIESSVLVLLLLISLIFIYKLEVNKTSLKNEVRMRNIVEISLKINEERLNKAQKIGKVGFWQKELNSDKIWASREAMIIFGFPPVEGELSTKAIYECIEDVQKVTQTTVHLIEKDKKLTIKFLIHPADGATEKTILSVAEVESNQNGNTVQITGIIQDITEQKTTEDALKESQSIYYSFIEHLPNAVFRNDIEGHYILVNSQFCKLIGLEKVNLIGRTPIEVSNSEIANSVEKKYFTKFAALSEVIQAKILQTGNSFDTEEEFIDVNGTRKTMHILRIPVQDSNGKIIGTQGMMFDITDRRESEKQLKLLSRAIENSPATVVITDKEGLIEYVNPKFTELTGYTLDESKGRNSRFLQSGWQTREFYEELWNTILSGKDWHGEFHNKKKNGESYWESSTISSIVDTPGEISYFVAVKEDITEKKKIIEELVAAKEKAEESDRLKSAFLANMSHEIRTPMNGILGFSELLKEPGLSGEEQQEYITIIEKSGARMLNIINDIIDISKIEAGQMDIYLSETNVNEQIKFVYALLKPEAEHKKLKLIIKNSLTEVITSTDREKLYAILINLVKNAIKYTDAGSIEFGYNLVETNLDHSLHFFVKDTGIGISKNRQNAIFERFIQAEIADKMARQGAGLGLSISKAYVEMLGGLISVESEEGKGSTFHFTIPYKPKTY